MQNPSAPPIILASSSRYRRGLLARLLDDFETVSPQVDEMPLPGEQPLALVGRLAREKAVPLKQVLADAQFCFRQQQKDRS